MDRTDVTTPVDEWIGRVPAELEAQLAMLAGPCPDVEIGSHCFEPRDCPFMERCWPQDPNHIVRLYNVGAKKTDGYFLRGIHWISDLPASEKLSAAAQRQLRSMQSGAALTEARSVQRAPQRSFWRMTAKRLRPGGTSRWAGCGERWT